MMGGLQGKEIGAETKIIFEQKRRDFLLRIFYYHIFDFNDSRY